MYGDGGDSGGPVFYGTTALGVYHGYAGSDKNQGLFTKAQTTESMLGVHVQFA
jgi:hypothetical protein